jgi:NADH-quinone oxidoreductase subunit G
VSFASSEVHEYLFDVDNYLAGAGLVELLAGVAVAACGRKRPPAIANLCKGVKSSAEQKRIAAALKGVDNALVVLGNIAGRHEAFSAVRALAAGIAQATGAKFGNLSTGANSAGAHLAGVTPHRGLGGVKRAAGGADAGSILDQSLDVLVLLNIEPDVDLIATDKVVSKLKKQEFVIALTPFSSDALIEAVDLLLPIGTFAETSGTYVNVAGTWQSFSGVANAVGEARPAWKVLRVIGNLIDAPDFDYVTSEDVRDELLTKLGSAEPDNAYKGKAKLAKPNGEDAPAAEIDTPIYSVDGVVRRAPALQLTPVALANSGESNS